MRHGVGILAAALTIQFACTGLATADPPEPAAVSATSQAAVTPLVESPQQTPEPTTPGATPEATVQASRPSTEPVMPSFGAALAGLPHDVWRSVSFDTVNVMGIGLGVASVGRLRDEETLKALQRDKRFDDFLQPGNIFGTFAVQAGGALAVYFGARTANHPKLARVAMDAFRANVVSQAWVQTMKVTANRRRPDGTRFSFPSGHSASAFATATIIQQAYGWKVGVPAYTLASYVAAARIAHNRHYLSDVLFGAAVGVAGGRTIALGRGGYRVHLGPAVTPGGVGIQGVVVPSR